MITLDSFSCSGCSACASACPKNCIEMMSDKEGFLYPHVNKEQCINCGICDSVCPIIHKMNTNKSCTAIAAMNLNEKIRIESSSGGIFTLIAEAIIDEGGIVFGAAFADDFKSVHHICVEKKCDLAKLRGSKYVQSTINNTYTQVKEYLDSGRTVLFTGTPCQIGGLYSFLRKTYDNLYTQDIICHGVPSPMVWKKYVEEREDKATSKTQQLSFRHKKYGWKKFSIIFEFSNCKKYLKSLHEDSFMKAFLSNICLRPSCYSCSFKSLNRQADITLADFWGVQFVLPEMDDDKGTSLVIINSTKGARLFSSISSKIIYKVVDIETVIKYNSAAVKSCILNNRRDDFFRVIQNSDFKTAEKKFLIEPIKNKLLRLFHRFFK